MTDAETEKLLDYWERRCRHEIARAERAEAALARMLDLFKSCAEQAEPKYRHVYDDVVAELTAVFNATD